ncbi:MAG: cation:proton antiporter [Caldilineaceae bacterium]|nr:cation:proton antiporter [Caldilineaceae bacterium]
MLHLPILLLQIVVILVVARMVGLLFRRLHQPQVIGEMVAGILLGPSLLGWLAPSVSATLFPPESLDFLSALSQIGLLLFMFLIGLEFDPQLLRNQGRAAVVTSYTSIIAPFILGVGLAFYLYPRLSDASVHFTSFALFMGIAMSITAFPVLARILAERRMLRSKVGMMTIACAAIDDVTGWSILAAIVLLVQATTGANPLWLMLVGTAFYLMLMFFGLRPLLQRLEAIFQQRGISQDMMTLIFLLILLSGSVTEWLGIHALFGAFLAGVIMPKQHSFVHALTEKLEYVAVVLLLPLFFAVTGLRTSIGLLNGAELWFYCALIILMAVAGKFGGSALAARWTGMSWREASAVGVLMNTRGLMELVVLNIGLDIGILSPTLFAMMVIMAIVTTVITAPLLQWIYFASPISYESTVEVKTTA